MFNVPVLGVLISIIAVGSACKYTAVLIKAAPCASNKDPVAVLKNIELTLESDDCKLKLKGCVELTKDVKELKVKFKVYKQNIMVLSGTKDGCTFKEGGIDLHCPLKKGTKICPDPTKLISVPGGPKTVTLARGGTIKVKVDVETGEGKYCYEGEGEVK